MIIKSAPEKDIKHSYLWDTNWVRPYESPISVYINFCNINVFKACDVIRLLDCKSGGFQAYFDETINYPVCGTLRFREKYMDTFFPLKHRKFPVIIGDIRYRSSFHYCPECIKQGYHSLLSQMPFETVCPIHKIRYVDSEKHLPIAMGGEYDVYSNVLGKFPLPPERTELDYAKISSHLKRKYNEKELYKVVYVDKDVNRLLNGNIGEIKRRKQIAVIRDGFDVDIFLKNVMTYLKEGTPNNKYLQRLYDDLDCFIKHFDCKYMNWDILSRVMSMACIADYTKDIGAVSNVIPHHSTYRSDDIYHAKLSYVYAARGSYQPSVTINPRFLAYYNGAEYRDVDDTGNTSLNDLFGRVSTLCFRDKDHLYSNKIDRVIEAMIVYDHFWYMSHVYEKEIHKRKTFDFYNTWKCIKPIIYEITYGKSGAIKINRITLK